MTGIVHIAINRFSNAADLPLPTYATEGASGMDLLAAIGDPITLAPLSRILIPTGISIALPHGYEGQIRPRSGLALKFGIGVLNGPGTIDSDYRGEIGVILVNFGAEPFDIHRGDKIAQLVVSPFSKAIWEENHSLPHTARAGQGFGSTGLRVTKGSHNALPK